MVLSWSSELNWEEVEEEEEEHKDCSRLPMVIAVPAVHRCPSPSLAPHLFCPVATLFDLRKQQNIPCRSMSSCLGAAHENAG